MPDKLTCLLVDDDPDDREVFLMTLDLIDRDIDCRTANNGADASAMVDPATQPDFIFLDVNMPKMNGIACLERLREMGVTSKIFMYSTTAEERVVERSRQLGAGFIVKPVSHKILQTVLTDLFNEFT